MKIMESPFDAFQKKKDYLICVDSDGCAMDTMDIKHIRCFGPCMVKEWHLEQWQEAILKRWNDINLYTMTRGINRFKGLAMALTEIDGRYIKIQDVQQFSDWVSKAPELSNHAVEEAYQNTDIEIFHKALSWSIAVNNAINALPQEEKKPFEGVAEGLLAAGKAADVAVVSSANRDAVEEEWKLYHLLEHIDILLCQDAGSKSHCIKELLKKGYAPDHVLMVGDAPGDRQAAIENGVYYYPILVRREKESWAEAPLAFSKLVQGEYQRYGQKKEKEFLDNLGGCTVEGKSAKCSNQEWLDGVYDKLLVKMKAECGRIGSMIPYITGKDGKYHDIEEGTEGIGFWTNGFWPGMLWQMYEATGDEGYRKAAVGVEERLDVLLRSPETVDHDVGFLFLLSSVANYRKTGDKDARRRGLMAASTLSARYNPDGRFIRAWNDEMAKMTVHFGGGDVRGWMIIDCMMNIPLLYWASEETKDPRFRKIAINHAKTAQQYITRPDGSCNHIVAFDPDSGAYLNNPGGQGYESGSSWSRGQSWAVYGFALSYRHTGDETFLDTAKRCAHYCIANLAVNDWLPLVDFRAPVDLVKYDSTAAMCIVCGLLEIAGHVGEHEKRFYIEAAYRILRACDAKFANWDPDADSIMTGGTVFYHDPTGENTEVPIIYADYYFIEAILRLKGKALFAW